MPTNRDWVDILKEITAAKQALASISLLYDGDKEQDFDAVLGRLFDLFIDIQVEACHVRPRKQRSLSSLFH